MPPAARIGDKVLQDGVHCHVPHTVGPVVVPIPTPALPLDIITGVPNVLIGGMPAATVTSMTTPCTLPGCTPGGPGTVIVGSATVLIGGLPAARVDDTTFHAICAVGVVPGPSGAIIPPGCLTVQIGG